MIDPNDAEWMLVSDYRSSWQKRLVLFRCEEHGYRAITAGDEDNFMSARPFRTCLWEYAKPLPEPKARPMTDAEIFKAIRDGAVVKQITSSSTTNNWVCKWKKQDFFISYDYIDNPENATWESLEVDDE